MENIYWIGLNDSEIEYSKDLFKKSITLNGNGNSNISYSKKYGIRINYNLDSNEIGEFYYRQIINVLKNDPEAKFMFYNPYVAYYYGERVVSKTICLNSYELLTKLRNKIKTRAFVEKLNLCKVLPHIELNGLNINYENLKKHFNNVTSEFVVQAEHSDGGNSTFLLNASNSFNQRFSKDMLYSVSSYIYNSVPVNTNIIIYDDDITIFPSSVQIIKNSNDKLCYKGADYAAYKLLPQKIRDQIDEANILICRELQKLGYRGICGIDYISDGDSVYFMEINERFQASTYLLNIELENRKQPSIHEMCIDAFKGKTCNFKVENFDINLSNYAFSHHFEKNEYIEFKLNRAKYDNTISKIVLDGFQSDLQIQKSAYLYKFVYNDRICGISPDNTVFLSNNICGLSNFDINNPMDVKIALICCGLYLMEDAKEKIKLDGGICDSINNGINITIFDCITVMCLDQTYHGMALTPFSLNFESDNFVLYYYDNYVSNVKLQPKQPIMKKSTKNGIPYRNIGILALDRVGINYQSLCIYKANNLECKFCNLSKRAVPFQLDDVYEVIESYIQNVEFRHFLIGGPAIHSADDYNRILKISRFISSKCEKPIYLMSLPIDDETLLRKLKANGVTEIAFNIELFDRIIAKQIMPGKANISINEYFSALKKATTIWQEPGAVRSMIVVGLESKKTLFNGIEALAKIGVSPILSPFGPAKGSLLENEIPENYEYFKEVYETANKICDKYKINLGPKCKYCQNNTLSITYN